MTIFQAIDAISETSEMTQEAHDLWIGMCKGDRNEYGVRVQQGEDPDEIARELHDEAVSLPEEDS